MTNTKTPSRSMTVYGLIVMLVSYLFQRYGLEHIPPETVANDIFSIVDLVAATAAAVMVFIGRFRARGPLRLQ